MKLFDIKDVARVLIYHSPVRMQASFDTLRDLGSKLHPKEGDLLVFLNKKQTYTKVLFRQAGADCIFAKRWDADSGRVFNSCSGRFSQNDLEKWLSGVVKRKRLK